MYWACTLSHLDALRRKRRSGDGEEGRDGGEATRGQASHKVCFTLKDPNLVDSKFIRTLTQAPFPPLAGHHTGSGGRVGRLQAASAHDWEFNSRSYQTTAIQS